MKGLFGACAAFATATVLTSGVAQAQPILLQRCNIDSLDPAGAEARLNWARRCALDLHVMDPTATIDLGVTTGAGSDGATLQEYVEDNTSDNWGGQNAYTGQVDSFEVNGSFVGKLYNLSTTFQNKDSKAYYAWSRAASRKKLRPMYPTFGSLYDINDPNNKQLFPHPTLANCNFYLDRYGTQLATGYSYYVNGYCEASCYTPEQKVLFSDGDVAIVDATAARREDVVTLAPESSLENIQLKTGRTYAYTAEFRDSEHPIVEIRTASGGLLRVTVEHPVVEGSGRLVAAQTLKVGDELVKKDGTVDPIVQVTRTKYFGKVYNLRPDTTDRVSNLLVAEGFVVGSSLFQNDEVGYINRIILHRNVPAHVIP